MTYYWKFVLGVLGLLVLFVCAVTVGNLVSWSQTLTKKPSLQEAAEEPRTRTPPVTTPAVQGKPMRVEPSPKPTPAPSISAPYPGTPKGVTMPNATGNPMVLATPPRTTAAPLQLSANTRRGLAVRLVNLKSVKTISSAAFASQPASQPTSQPVLAKYHNLIKNEFMLEDDAVRLTTPEITAAIRQIRASAAAEKENIDRSIMDVTREIAAANAVKKNETRAKRDSQVDASRHDRNANTVHMTPRGTHVHHDATQESLADSAKAEARTHRAQANAAQSDTRALVIEKMELQKRSAALAGVASPYSRVLPPQQFWNSLPPIIQDQLSMVGLTLDEFRELIRVLDVDEKEFTDLAQLMETETRNTDELVAGLRNYFEKQMSKKASE